MNIWLIIWIIATVVLTEVLFLLSKLKPKKKANLMKFTASVKLPAFFISAILCGVFTAIAHSAYTNLDNFCGVLEGTGIVLLIIGGIIGWIYLNSWKYR